MVEALEAEVLAAVAVASAALVEEVAAAAAPVAVGKLPKLPCIIFLAVYYTSKLISLIFF